MAEDEDDYLSDKFLQQLTSKSDKSFTQTYSQRRKEAQRIAETRNIAGRTKSRKELEKETIDTLKEGMATSLFEREKLAEAEGGTQSKAMKMMNFRSRNKLEYEERRDNGRLASAQKTCSLLDERAGITFNFLWINPLRPVLIPTLLLDALGIEMNDDIDDTYRSAQYKKRKDHLERLVDEEISNESVLAKRLKQEMRRDALTSSDHHQDYGEDDSQLPMKGGRAKKNTSLPENDIEITDEVIERAKDFLQSPVKTRLDEVLGYMRGKHHFCFWCGTEYKSKEEMDATCPGETEDMHD
ncbi:hypothetical protein FRC19_002293 [Serendipita sp. 401]|nr:hypothetical protein FRC19_002293 [Serendipita sp. 401]